MNEGLLKKINDAERIAYNVTNGVTDLLIPPSPFTVIIPLENPNGHSYEIGSPVLVTTGDRGFGIDGRMGNHLPSHHETQGFNNNTRPADDEEIRYLFDNLRVYAEEGSPPNGLAYLEDALRRYEDG